jgi:predicted metal-dependent HD superfamily phosphohydrolase
MAVDESIVRATWHAAMPAGAPDTVAWEALTARYREPHRHYHTLAHLAGVVTQLERLIDALPEVADPTALRLAALYHDAVYDPRSSSNEPDSARLARQALAGLGVAPEVIARTEALILATAPDAVPPEDLDTAVLLDADLSVLGAEPAVYAAYVRGVRAEYGHLDDEAWRRGRAGVLRSFLDRPTIYRTELMRTEREHRARANLSAELASLRSP